MTDLPTILLTGGNGQVGRELRRTLMVLGNVCAPGSTEFDLTDPDGMRDYIRKYRPDWIVNPAAYTAVDKAESERDLCRQVNVDGVRILAELAEATGAALIHFSTDYVFDGASTRPYREDDAPAPLNWYGRTKLDGERAVQASTQRALIFRTAWVYGAGGNNFVATMQRLFAERESVSVVDDQRGAPTWARAIAEATAQVLAQCRDPSVLERGAGLYHMSCAGETSWYEFARRIHDRMAEAGTPRLATIQPIPTHEYPTPAARAAYSVLDNSRLQQVFGIRLPHWEKGFELAAPEFGL